MTGGFVNVLGKVAPEPGHRWTNGPKRSSASASGSQDMRVFVHAAALPHNF